MSTNRHRAFTAARRAGDPRTPEGARAAERARTPWVRARSAARVSR
ncbi:hypothetical protein O7599_09435 [Streptomyces sp. WMMC500]|nr:hypothetical protein [Streptomyces sp. WMMC500]WBB62730.1 hypothetical protein O7599_09435 [Streptomyces sp. WMMC500]